MIVLKWMLKLGFAFISGMFFAFATAMFWLPLYGIKVGSLFVGIGFIYTLTRFK